MKYWMIMLALAGWLFVGCQPGENESTADNEGQDTTQTEEPSEKPLLSPPDSTSATLGDLTVQINYGSPSVRERVIWDELVPYGEIWRTGANEATTFAVNQDVMIGEDTVSAGRYALFTIPADGEWTVILNRDADQWGAYEYNEEEDALRFMVTPEMTDTTQEKMTFKAEAEEAAVHVHFMWEKLTFTFAVQPLTAN